MANDGTEGYIISRNIVKNRRPVALFMLGRRPKQMVSEFSGVNRMSESLNYRFLEAGLSYPTYTKGYSSTYAGH